MRRIKVDLGYGDAMAVHVDDDAPPEVVDELAAIGRAAIAYAEAHPLTPEQIARQDRMRARARAIRERAR